MSNVTFDDLRCEVVAFSKRNEDGGDLVQTLIKESGFDSMEALETAQDPAVYEDLINKLRKLSAWPPWPRPLYESILNTIQWPYDSECEINREAIYRAIVAAEASGSLDPTQKDHVLRELKARLPGKPSIASIRAELEAPGRRARKHPLPKGAELVIFRHHESDSLYAGIHDPGVDRFLPDFGLARIKGRDSIANICAQAGRPPINPASIPSGTFEFLPGNTRQVLKAPSGGYTVNQWTTPTLREKAERTDAVPPTIRKLLFHVLGSDERVYAHFLNWLSAAYQLNTRTGTAWVIAGAPGTGKGILFGEIIRPLFGADYCKSMTAKNLEDRFNEWFAKCTMLDVDEAKVVGFQAPQVEAALRMYITEPLIEVTEKNRNSVTVANHCNVILTSNDPRPVSIPEGDRRYNVAPRQERSLKSLLGGQKAVGEMVASIRDELPRFAGFLAQYRFDVSQAREPMQTEERETTIENSTTTTERISRALKNGDLDYFLEEFWTATEGSDLFSTGRDAQEARRVLVGWSRVANHSGAKRVSHQKVPACHVAAVYNFLMPEKFQRSPQEVGRALGLKADSRCGPKENRGRAYRVTWRTEETPEQFKETIAALTGIESEEGFAVKEEDWRVELTKDPKSVLAADEPHVAEMISKEPESWDDTSLTKSNSRDASAPNEPLTARNLFVQLLNVDGQVADILVQSGLSTIEEVSRDLSKKLNGKFNKEDVEALQSRAQQTLTESRKSCKDMSPPTRF